MPDDVDVTEGGIALVRFAGGGPGLFIPDKMRRRLSPRAVRLARELQSAARRREQLLIDVDRLAPELRAAGASWPTIAYLTNMSTAGAVKRWGGEPGDCGSDD